MYIGLLDRLVVAYQLLKLSASSSLEEFSRSSNIESIVESEEKAGDLNAVEDRMRGLGLE